MLRTSRLLPSWFLAGLFSALRFAGATDLELVTRANPISDTPQSDRTPVLSLFAPSFSQDERYVAYPHTGPNVSPGQIDVKPHIPDIFLWDRATGISTLVSHAADSLHRTGNDSSIGALSVSGEGRFVTFASQATDLVTGQVDTAQTSDIFTWDRTTGVIRLVTHTFDSPVKAAGGTFSATMSVDGRYIAFVSSSPDFLPGIGGISALYLWERESGSFTLISHRAGQFNVAASGTYSLSAPISADGGIVVFSSTATDLVAGQVDAGTGSDLFVWTRETGACVLASRVLGTWRPPPMRVPAESL